ncbi:Oidioi.mRNA.OKI2018_I69.chr2.g6357.t1.cds [Oikopleura dioica]|uniref:Oidioi.mRNA.OKI2018_I69.chr2.g6357.t1.cds n=1 Tax=Oikopleura dioica TaxID=34765 RepID=A0ABN7TC32_OIKDI|nr:Oidioi.mRNA.OKI2018_I69.chr2.g6357.t1.cds [Oikopleura dioica]
MRALFLLFYLSEAVTNLRVSSRNKLTWEEEDQSVATGINQNNTYYLIIVQSGSPEQDFKKAVSKKAEYNVKPFQEPEKGRPEGANHLTIMPLSRENGMKKKVVHITLEQKNLPKLQSFSENKDLLPPTGLYSSNIDYFRFTIDWRPSSSDERQLFYVRLYELGYSMSNPKETWIRDYMTRSPYFSPFMLKSAMYHKIEIYTLKDSTPYGYERSVSAAILMEVKTLGVAPQIESCEHFYCDQDDSERQGRQVNVDSQSCKALNSLCWNDADDNSNDGECYTKLSNEECHPNPLCRTVKKDQISCLRVNGTCPISCCESEDQINCYKARKCEARYLPDGRYVCDTESIECRAICNPGFINIGKDIVTCTDNGWDGRGECVRPSCGPPQLLASYPATFSSCTNQDFEGSQCMMDCDDITENGKGARQFLHPWNNKKITCKKVGEREYEWQNEYSNKDKVHPGCLNYTFFLQTEGVGIEAESEASTYIWAHWLLNMNNIFVCAEGDENSFICDVGTCIASRFVCDGFDNCGDGSDEKNCEIILKDKSGSITTSSFEFYVEPKFVNIKVVREDGVDDNAQIDSGVEVLDIVDGRYKKLYKVTGATTNTQYRVTASWNNLEKKELLVTTALIKPVQVNHVNKDENVEIEWSMDEWSDDDVANLREFIYNVIVSDSRSLVESSRKRREDEKEPRNCVNSCRDVNIGPNIRSVKFTVPLDKEYSFRLTAVFKNGKQTDTLVLNGETREPAIKKITQVGGRSTMASFEVEAEIGASVEGVLGKLISNEDWTFEVEREDDAPENIIQLKNLPVNEADQIILAPKLKTFHDQTLRLGAEVTLDFRTLPLLNPEIVKRTNDSLTVSWTKHEQFVKYEVFISGVFPDIGQSQVQETVSCITECQNSILFENLNRETFYKIEVFGYEDDENYFTDGETITVPTIGTFPTLTISLTRKTTTTADFSLSFSFPCKNMQLVEESKTPGGYIPHPSVYLEETRALGLKTNTSCDSESMTCHASGLVPELEHTIRLSATCGEESNRATVRSTLKFVTNKLPPFFDDLRISSTEITGFWTEDDEAQKYIIEIEYPNEDPIKIERMNDKSQTSFNINNDYRSDNFTLKIKSYYSETSETDYGIIPNLQFQPPITDFKPTYLNPTMVNLSYDHQQLAVRVESQISELQDGFSGEPDIEGKYWTLFLVKDDPAEIIEARLRVFYEDALTNTLYKNSYVCKMTFLPTDKEPCVGHETVVTRLSDWNILTVETAVRIFPEKVEGQGGFGLISWSHERNYSDTLIPIYNIRICEEGVCTKAFEENGKWEDAGSTTETFFNATGDPEGWPAIFTVQAIYQEADPLIESNILFPLQFEKGVAIPDIEIIIDHETIRSTSIFVKCKTPYFKENKDQENENVIPAKTVVLKATNEDDKDSPHECKVKRSDDQQSGDCTFRGLLPSTTYDFNLRVEWDEFGALSIQKPATTAPAPPYAMEEIAKTSSIELKWSNRWKSKEISRHLKGYEISAITADDTEDRAERKFGTEIAEWLDANLTTTAKILISNSSEATYQKELFPLTGYKITVVADLGELGKTDELIIEGRTALPPPDLKFFSVESSSVTVFWPFHEVEPIGFASTMDSEADNDEDNTINGNPIKSKNDGYYLTYVSDLFPKKDVTINVSVWTENRLTDKDSNWAEYPWKRLEYSDDASILTTCPPQMKIEVGNVRDISTTLEWEDVDGADEYILIYEYNTTEGTGKINSPYFAGGNIVHLDSGITKKTISPLVPFTTYNFLMKAKFDAKTEADIDKYTDMLRLSIRTATEAPNITLFNETLTSSLVTFNWPNCHELKCPSEAGCPSCATIERRKRRKRDTHFFDFKYDVYPIQWQVKINGLNITGHGDSYIDDDESVQELGNGTTCRVYDTSGYPTPQFENLRPGTTYKVEIIVEFNEFEGKKTLVRTDENSENPEIIKEIDAKVEVIYDLQTLDPNVNVLLLIDNTDAVDGRKEIEEDVLASLPLVLRQEQIDFAVEQALKNSVYWKRQMSFLQELMSRHKYIGDDSSRFAMSLYEGYQNLDEIHTFESLQEVEYVKELLGNVTYNGGTFMPFHGLSYAAVKGISTGLLNSTQTEERPNVIVMTISNTLYLPASIANVIEETIIKTSRLLRFCSDATLIPVGVHPPKSSRGIYGEKFEEMLRLLACWEEEEQSMLEDENFKCDVNTGFCTYEKGGNEDYQKNKINEIKGKECPNVHFVPQDGNYIEVVDSIKQLIVDKTLEAPIDPNQPKYIIPRKNDDRQRTCLALLAKMTGKSLESRAFKTFREGEL